MRKSRWAAAALLAVFNLSCFTSDVNKIHPDDIRPSRSQPPYRDITVLEIVTKTGARIEFSEQRPGLIADGKVVGTAQEAVSIPLEDVDWMWVRIRRVDAGKTVLAVLGVGGFAALTGLAVALTFGHPSCPFVYSYDGQNYVYDAEPYAGSAVKGAQRAELWTLEHLRPDGGEYRLLVTNPAPETEFVDEVKLLAVDHPPGITVVPGVSTTLHSVENAIPPVRASDARGRDLTDLVRADDRLFWQSREDGRNLDDTATLRDMLVFEFAKPRGPVRAKLLFNGNSTSWGPESIKRYLALYGDRVGSFYGDSGGAGPDLSALLGMHLREEFFALKVWVETVAGWQNRGLLSGGPPLIAQTRAVPLDLSDVPGDVVRIRLAPPAPYWKINYVAMDFSADVPQKVTEIGLARAADGRGRDVAALLAKADGAYFIMPEGEAPLEVAFAAPPPAPGLKRTVILKAAGYYEPRVAATGQPQAELLDRLHREPGFALRRFYAEYLRWKEEMRAASLRRPEAAR